MGIFKSNSRREPNPLQDIKPEHDYKMATNYEDNRLLQAVNEAQPFEQVNLNTAGHFEGRRQSYLLEELGNIKDIFGQQITQGDMSNPTRSRNERPLDTIRAFEYAITGDISYRDQLETQRLGWGFHEDFPFNNFQRQALHQGFERPMANFSGAEAQGIYQAPNYSASSLKPGAQKQKKKRGLFGRKK